MRVLLDECVPRKFRSFLPGHDCHTVPEMGLAGKKNGELLALAEESGFQAFLTLDRGIEYQQNLHPRTIAVVLIRSKSNRWLICCPKSRTCCEYLSPLSLVNWSERV